MITPSQASSNKTTLQKEGLLFREIFGRLLETFLNRIFDLRPEKAKRRTRNLVLLFLILGLLTMLLRHPLFLWIQHLQQIFLYLLNPATGYTSGNPFIRFFTLAYQTTVEVRLLQYPPILLASFFIALQLSAIYLADIFELPDVNMACQFVSAVALFGSDETIRIREGDIAEQYRASPNYVIGGPGKVIVDVDSVALFERADGTPHVIGPTGKEPGGKATIEGFERFRRALYIRDQSVDLADQDPRSRSVMGRSRDGIPIGATDVSLIYSIYRGENARPSSEVPFPFSGEAVENIVYKSTSRVTPEQAYPSTYEFSWMIKMIGLVRRELGGFMSEWDLAEYLPHVETPFRSSSSPAEFIPRHKITNLFSQFAGQFTEHARDNGMELHWIGAGVWKVPDIISEKQLEAWTLQEKNLRDGNDDAINKLENEAFLQKIEALIKNVPIRAFYDILDMKGEYIKRILGGKQEMQPNADETLLLAEEEILATFDGKEFRIEDLKELLNEKIKASVAKQIRDIVGELSYQDRINKLLVEYRKQLLEAVQFMKIKNKPVKPAIEDAIDYINRWLAVRGQ